MSFVATAIIGGIGAAGAIGGAKIASSGAKKAAQTQAEAANYAADQQYKASQEALAEQKRQYDINQANQAPWLEAGKYGLTELVKGMPEFTAPYTEQFKAPTVTDDPGYQFRLNEGLKAINATAAAKGGALSGGAVKQAMRYGEDLASQEYGNAYDRARQQYLDRYNIAQANQANRYNRLAALSGTGQVAANQLNASGQDYANQTSNIILDTAARRGDYATQGANARASGYVAGGNTWGNALANTGNSVMNAIMLSQLFKPKMPMAPDVSWDPNVYGWGIP